jgi:hypothetical protein
MSKPAASAPATPSLPTRRQLDELEALLQRMLELPVQPAEDDYLPQTGPPEIDQPADEAADQMAAWREATAQTETETIPNFQEAADFASSQEDHARESSRLFTETAPAENRAWMEAEEDEKPIAPSTLPFENREPPGVAGVMIRGQPEAGVFRILLGWSGLLCLIVSLAILLLDWFGWTW